MKLSVVVPVYNCEPYLKCCFDSLANQTIDDYEVIIINDGSTDNSQAVIEEYVNKYPFFSTYYQENGGLSSARNLGMKYAKGEFISFIDSDDWVDLDFYEKGLKIADEHGYDVIVYDMIDHYPSRDVHHYLSNFENRFKMSASASNKVFRRSVVGDKQFAMGLWYEDLEFTTRVLFLTENIGRVHDSYYHCHCREESIMSNHNSPKNRDIAIVVDRLIAFLNENNLYDKYKNEIEYITLEHIAFSAIKRVSLHDNPKREEVIADLRKYVLDHYPNYKKDLKALGFTGKKALIIKLNLSGKHHLAKNLLNLSAKLKGR